MQGLRTGRRRTALNEALHELRRPLQALALTVRRGERPVEPAAIQGSVQMAATALERLEREINGDRRRSRAGADAPSGRCSTPRSGAGGRARRLPAARWRCAGRAARRSSTADRCELAQALDNLIVNAIEHGGPEIVVEARLPGGAFCGWR